MLLPSLEGPRHRLQTATIRHIPIPVNGWSTRDKYTASFSREALRYCPLTYNWMWIDGRLTVRPGFTTHGTGMTDPVESLFEYAALAGTRTLFAATSGTNTGAAGDGCKIWNVTSAGAATSVTTDLNGARWQHTMFSTTSAVYLVIANGSDDVRMFDGTNWTTPTLTGVTSANLIHVTAHKGRLWFTEKNTLSAWYLPAFAITGTVTEYDISPFCRKGGYLMAVASWTYDGGSGPDDYIVFITSEGEVIIYAGLDPNSVDEWSLVGIFQIDRPIGRRCFTKFGADLAIFTESGPVQLSQVFAKVSGRDELADPIRDEFISAVSEARSTFGWEVVLYTRRGWLFCNIPKTTGANEQYIYNPMMQAWFRFTEIDASCWVQSGNSMYFGGTGVVYVWDDGQVDDDGSAVQADVAFNFWNYGTGTTKLFTMMRPHYVTDGSISPAAEMKVDFDESPPTAQSEVSEAGTGTAWNDGDWDTFDWAGGVTTVREWLTAEGEGVVGAPRIKVSTISAKLSLTAVDVAYLDGGIL